MATFVALLLVLFVGGDVPHVVVGVGANQHLARTARLQDLADRLRQPRAGGGGKLARAADDGEPANADDLLRQYGRDERALVDRPDAHLAPQLCGGWIDEVRQRSVP